MTLPVHNDIGQESWRIKLAACYIAVTILCVNISFILLPIFMAVKIAVILASIFNIYNKFYILVHLFAVNSHTGTCHSTYEGVDRGYSLPSTTSLSSTPKSPISHHIASIFSFRFNSSHLHLPSLPSPISLLKLSAYMYMVQPSTHNLEMTLTLEWTCYRYCVVSGQF